MPMRVLSSSSFMRLSVETARIPYACRPFPSPGAPQRFPEFGTWCRGRIATEPKTYYSPFLGNGNVAGRPRSERGSVGRRFPRALRARRLGPPGEIVGEARKGALEQ